MVAEMGFTTALPPALYASCFLQLLVSAMHPRLKDCAILIDGLSIRSGKHDRRQETYQVRTLPCVSHFRFIS